MELFGNKQESIRKAHLKSLEEDKFLRCKVNMEEKTRFGNLNRFMNKQHIEFEDQQEIQKGNEKAALNEYQHEQENNLARELAEVKVNDIRQLKLRQQLRENSHELRELERKLKAAYINKELAAQIAQKEAERINEKIQEKRTHNIWVEALMKEEELKRMLAEEDIIKKAQYKQELQEQIILGEKSKRFLYEEFLREKKMIDDVIQRIHDEDEREMQERMCRMQKTREEMMDFKAAQDEWKQRRKREIEDENRKIQEFLQKKSADSSARLQEKKRREEVKAKIQENLAKQIHEETERKKERDEILQELMLEEQKEAADQRFREDVEKQVRLKLEIRKSLDAQLREKEEKIKQEAAEDAKYKEQLLNKLAEDEKIEQMSAQKRRMKMLQLRRDVEQMMTDRRQKRAEEMQLMIRLQEQEEKEMEDRRKIIEEERIVLLKDHVKNLIGYLPKGLLKPEDLPYICGDYSQYAGKST
ncbi:meiosis-specific nuclear structural protein 1-like [Anthonomus grandis grandis]|uniref:meiosis-specific nuclear structural protein 1-like n=1 Tax=Anthonomus grandis grandis TaxID=2921223 RepID=UPI002165BDE5|nr:meiosis-specific nuclear structural protein 1-like [Anthonomus grandis grandis]